jgi:hypothetical protein
MQFGERSILRAESDFHAGGKQPLPVINGLWIGQLSPLEQLCIKSFVVQGHPYHLYTYDRLDNVPDGVTVQDAGEILPQSLIFRNQLGKGKGSLAAFSDLFRYKLLLERGGWWVDTDVFCLKPFDFSAPYVFGAEDKPVASGVIKMPQGCPLAERCYELARQVDPKTIVWNELVAILERGVKDMGLMSYVLRPETFSPIAWHDVPDYILGRKNYRPSTKSYGVHLYNEMWRRNNLDKWRRYPSTSALNVLRRYAGLPEEQGADSEPMSILLRPATVLKRYWPFTRAA